MLNLRGWETVRGTLEKAGNSQATQKALLLPYAAALESRIQQPAVILHESVQNRAGSGLASISHWRA